MTDNEKRLDMIIISYKGRCPKCKKGLIMYRVPKSKKYPTKFLGCEKFPKCDWTSYKEAL